MRRQPVLTVVVPLLQLVTDIAAAEGAFLLAYWLRFHSPLTHMFPVTKGFPGFPVYFLSSIAVIVIWLAVFNFYHLYGVRRNIRYISDLWAVVRAVTLGLLLVTAAAFFFRGFSYSRLVFVLIWITSILLIGTTRFILQKFEKALYRRGKGLLRSAVIGSSEWGRHVARQLSEHPENGLTVVGFLGENPSLDGSLLCLGDTKDVARIAEDERIDVFILAFEQRETDWLEMVLNETVGVNVEFYLIPGVLEMMTSRLRLLDLAGVPILKIKDLPMSAWNMVLKNIFDIFVSIIVLSLAWPLFLLIALAVRLDSKGSVFYRQERMGMDGQVFELIKFRTMYSDVESTTGPKWAVKGDPRVTRVGKILRRTSLDELPQLINIVRGDMSLVGPRPERPYFARQFRSRIPRYLERLRVKTGMTGWAQVNGLRGNVPIDERTRYDVYYVENWSFLLDAKILLMTIWIVLRGKNSY